MLFADSHAAVITRRPVIIGMNVTKEAKNTFFDIRMETTILDRILIAGAQDSLSMASVDPFSALPHDKV